MAQFTTKEQVLGRILRTGEMLSVKDGNGGDRCLTLPLWPTWSRMWNDNHEEKVDLVY